MISQMSYVMTLANSIIGVSVLAMPFCFKQCGIILATLVLILSSILSRLACHFLIKSAVMSRRRNFELLAFHALGHMGKFLVELFIIGFLVGTCIAFFVVMGDLGPQIVGKAINKNPEDIRTSLLITTSIFIVLPLGLLRNIDSLSSLCTATIIFYLCLVLKIVTESMHHIFAGDWYEHVYYWRPSGILQCVPIFSMALFCQTQLFEIYETIPNASLEKMNEVVRGALNICTIVYLCVGFFGYIAFCTQPFTGNILMSLEPNLSSEMIKMGFVFSIAFSFPLVIFPCRASLNSLLFRKVYAHEPSMNYLPETRFRCLTIIIVLVSLITGIIIPNIEFVLGLVGSTIGVMICLIFPAIFFISISSKHTNERLLAQVILFIGICIMILSTYANLYALEASTNVRVLVPTSKPHNQMKNLMNLDKDNIESNVPNAAEILPIVKERIGQAADTNSLDKSPKSKANDIRQEPPIPVERIIVTEKAVIGSEKSVAGVLATFAPEIKQLVEEKSKNEGLYKQSEILVGNNIVPTISPVTEETGENNRIEIKENFEDRQKNENLINSDAIKREESELAADADVANILAAERHEKLRQTLEKHRQEQLQMMEEQKEILKDLKEQKQEIEREKQKVIKDTQISKVNDKQLEMNNEIPVLNANRNMTKLNKNQEEMSRNLVENSKDKLLDAVVPNDKTSNEQQAILIENKNSHSIQGAANKTFQDKVNNRKIKREDELRTNNSNKLPNGPILNALTKRVSQNSISVNNISGSNGVENNVIMHKSVSVAVTSDLQSKQKLKTDLVQDEYSVKSASKILNQIYTENAPILTENNTKENIPLIRRDILEDHERKRRDINLTVENADSKVASDDINEKSQATMKDIAVHGVQKNEKCIRQAQRMTENAVHEIKKEFIQNSSKSNVMDASLIKTNVYLSHQEFTNAVSMDPNIPMREYVNLKQRDLKSMDTH